MTRISLIGAIVFLFAAQAQAQEVYDQTRYLSRALVWHCETEAAPEPEIVFLPEGVEPPLVEGELPAGVSCATADSYDGSTSAGGRLLVTTDDAGTILEMVLEASIHAAGRTYRFADWVEVTGHSQSGHVYQVRSLLRENAQGHSLEYSVRFVRRTPDLCVEESTGLDMTCYDRTTMIGVTLDEGVSAMLDFRPPSPKR